MARPMAATGGSMLRADVEDDLVGIDRIRGEDRAVDHEVRSVGHERPVLEAGRLALGAVHDDDRPAARALGDRPPLAPDRETGTATTEEAARLEVVDEVPSDRAWRGRGPSLAWCASSRSATPSSGGPASRRSVVGWKVNLCSVVIPDGRGRDRRAPRSHTSEAPDRGKGFPLTVDADVAGLMDRGLSRGVGPRDPRETAPPARPRPGPWPPSRSRRRDGPRSRAAVPARSRRARPAQGPERDRRRR